MKASEGVLASEDITGERSCVVLCLSLDYGNGEGKCGAVLQNLVDW